jgi:hypothetical protein
VDLGLGRRGGGAMSDREYRDDCTCASCIAVDVEMHRFAVRSMGDGRKLVDVSYRERALAAEALVRAKDEAIGELLESLRESAPSAADGTAWKPEDLVDDVSDLGWA